MSKRPDNSRAPPAAPVDVVERLKVVANDAVLPRETVENSESVSVTAAFATLLAGDNSNKVSSDCRWWAEVPNTKLETRRLR
ncbi:hypothetical protein AAVH_06789 [Aphelenchoides avenae]|nr:hypothetical protein AAVH_06789 [Aphelenchus avenae]